MASTKVTKPAAAEPAPVERVEKRCSCGCNAVVNPKRSFKPGHDARYKSALLNRFDAGDAEAGKTLVERGWKTAEELQARKAKVTAKTEAKAKREADRTARVQAKVDTKPDADVVDA